MSKLQVFLKYWLWPVMWMILIFSASADTQSYPHSSHIVGPILRWFFPHISEHTVNVVVFIVRKCAHLTEYAVLAWLFWRALRKPVKRDPRPWSWREAKISVLLVATYAATDEFHQIFVPTRGAHVSDVFLDTFGALMGIVVLWLLGRWFNCWSNSEIHKSGNHL